MNEEPETQLVNELQRVINRFRAEYDIKYAAAIGCLEMVKLDLYQEGREMMEDEE